MLSLEELSRLRFGMSDLPKAGGTPGAYEERCSQWFLEQSFFRDFTYRNPRGRKKGEELADAVVLFDDVALLVQVKAQCGSHDPRAWATEATLTALKQARATHGNLVNGHIKKLKNDLYGEIDYEPRAYPNLYGIIILAQNPAPFVVEDLVPEVKHAGFPVHVFSLHDFALIASRFDTAADFIQFLELRTDIGWIWEDTGYPLVRAVGRVALPRAFECVGAALPAAVAMQRIFRAPSMRRIPPYLPIVIASEISRPGGTGSR